MKRLLSICLAIVLVLSLNFVAITPVQASNDLEWSWANPYPQGNDLEAISYGNGKFVAVGVHGTIITSADRVTWNIQSSGTTENLYDVRWFDSLQQFLCVGDESTVLTSADGVSWAELDTGLPDGQFRAVELKGNQYVILEDKRYVRVSDDGITWSRVDLASVLPAFLYLYDITHNNNQYVVVGQGGSVITSTDGLIWTLQTTPITDVLRSVVWAGQPLDQFVAVGNGGTVMTSSDAINWYIQSTDTISALNDVMWDGSQFVAVGNPQYAGENILVLTSPDGSSWTRHNTTNFWASLTGTASDGSHYLAVGYGGAILGSDSGASWYSISHGVSQDLWDVTWDGNQFAAVGNLGTIVTSPNGVDWTQQPVNLQGSPHLRGITWDGDEFIAVGQYATLLFSSDGVAWTKRSTGQIMNITFRDVIWAGDPLNKYIIVGSLGTILTSDDGTTWIPHDLGLDMHVLKSVAWSGSKLVIVGGGLSITDRVIITSHNGEEWTVHSTNIGFNDVIWDESQFVAVSSGQYIYTSTDGEVWNQSSSSASQALLFGVAWNGYRHMAVGRAMVSSLDGQNWEEQASITPNDLYGITWGATQFVAVGQSGTILVAGEPLAEVQGYKWEDTNGDGVWDQGELGMPGVTIYVDLSQDDVLDEGEPSTVTNENGWYSIAGLPSGVSLRINEIVPDDYEQTFPAVAGFWDLNLSPGQVITDINFGNRMAEIIIQIDIKPGSDPNSINLNSKGVIPVAILTEGSFDAASVDATTVWFGKTGSEAEPVHHALDDVDDDGDMDMIFHFRTQETGLEAEDTEAILTGLTIYGIEITGTDSVRIVPPKGKGKPNKGSKPEKGGGQDNGNGNPNPGQGNNQGGGNDNPNSGQGNNQGGGNGNPNPGQGNNQGGENGNSNPGQGNGKGKGNK